MLWIGLAVGSIVGLAVWLIIRLATWVGDRISASGGEQDGIPPRRAASSLYYAPPARADSAEEVAPWAQRRDAAIRIVDDIKQELGERRIDVVWTITNSALWDVAVPSSKRFFTSLTVWDDHRDGWTVDETVAAAAELKVLWRAALSSATRLGVNHLSEDDRPKADTAIKLVRKADSTASEAERHQLMSKAAEVLSGIMSITIPRETMRAIESGESPPELEDPPPDSSRGLQ